MLLVLATLICAAQPDGSISGRVLDAVSGRAVRGAVVSMGDQRATVTSEQGTFVLSGLPDGTVDLIVQHPSYEIFARATVPVGRYVEIRLKPSSIQMEPVEIVETREEDLRPLLLYQTPFSFPLKFQYKHRGQELKGMYRVCVATDGKVSLVAALEPALDADPYVKEGIATGWRYRQLSQPACFMWRVTLRFNGPPVITKPAVNPYAPPERPPEPTLPPPGYRH